MYLQDNVVSIINLWRYIERKLEKKGCVVTLVEMVVPVPVPVVAVGVVVILVIKNSSVPTLSTDFWLLMAAMRGLNSTCTRPCVSKKWIKAVKLSTPNAGPKIPAEVGPAPIAHKRQLNMYVAIALH